MARVFISYRRTDNPDAAGRLYDRLRPEFGDDSVFFDVDTIPVGTDFSTHIETVLADCDVVLAVIGDA